MHSERTTEGSVMYSEITTQDDNSSLQTHINRLSTLSNTWQTNFNPTKCNIMTITGSIVVNPARYYIPKHKLENTLQTTPMLTSTPSSLKQSLYETFCLQQRSLLPVLKPSICLAYH